MSEVDERIRPVGPHPYDSPLRGVPPERSNWFKKPTEQVNTQISPLNTEIRLQGIIADYLGPPGEIRHQLGDLYNYAIDKRARLNPEQIGIFRKIVEDIGGLDRLEESLPGIMQHNLKSTTSHEKDDRISLATQSPEIPLRGKITDYLGPPEEARRQLGDLYNYAIDKRAGLNPLQIDIFREISINFGGLDLLEEALPGIMQRNLKSIVAGSKKSIGRHRIQHRSSHSTPTEATSE